MSPVSVAAATGPGVFGLGDDHTMRGPEIQATLDRIQPVVITGEDGVSWCPWPYYQRSEKGSIAAHIWELDIHEECQRWGFRQYHVHRDREALNHSLMLLGPDSPGEYIYTFDSRLIGDDSIEDLGRDMVWWIKRMSAVYRIQSGAQHGKRTV